MSGRHRYIWRDGAWLELNLDAPLPKRVCAYVQSDIGEYRSVITREMITSRSQHRDHLREHNCIEVGNEYLPSQPAPLRPVRGDIQRAIEASPETRAEARAVTERATAAVKVMDV